MSVQNDAASVHVRVGQVGADSSPSPIKLILHVLTETIVVDAVRISVVAVLNLVEPLLPNGSLATSYVKCATAGRRRLTVHRTIREGCLQIKTIKFMNYTKSSKVASVYQC